MRRLLLAAALVVGLASCGGDDGGEPGAAGGATTATAGASIGVGTSAPPATGRLNVLAAASLTAAFDEAATVLETSGLTITSSFAGSQALVSQLKAGAPADVVALADQPSMDQLVQAGLVEAPTTFATNALAIAVAPGNPKGIRGLADLARGDLTVVLAAPQVPIGRYAREALGKAGATVASRSDEQDVKAALAKVTSGEADATIVYATDVRASRGKAEAVAIPAVHDVRASYPIAVVKGTRERPAAERFVREATSGVVQEALRAAGFGPPG